MDELNEVADDEKLWALLAHLAPLACLAFIGPIIALLVKQDSPFVKYHAIQALAFQFASVMIVTTISWVTCGLGSPLGLLVVVGSIVVGIGAYGGKMDGYPLLSGIGKPPPRL